MFELNDNIEVKESLFKCSSIYTIDNFYKNPDKIVNFLLEKIPDFHNKNEYPSFNSIYFEDRRHNIKSDEVFKIYNFLSNICKQNIECNHNEIITNFCRFKKHKFNDYKNNYWCPHKDNGYTAIVFLNENDFYSGTNLYEKLNINEDCIDNFPEHYAPWKNKKKFKLINSIEPKYNRMVLFDGFKYLHGMNICNDDYFGENYRMNQVVFFQDPNYLK